ncbi:MAG: hypothetical protein NT013_09625 [Planctomycetia bacterium]|nr:hypothetical protein [Planctomycetia bacterium]
MINARVTSYTERTNRLCRLFWLPPHVSITVVEQRNLEKYLDLVLYHEPL